MRDQVHTLPRVECGKLQDCHWTNPDPTFRRVTTPTKAKAPIGPGGGPETFQGCLLSAIQYTNPMYML